MKREAEWVELVTTINNKREEMPIFIGGEDPNYCFEIEVFCGSRIPGG